MLKSFPAFIERIKQDQRVLIELIKAYELDDQKPIIPQLVKKLGRGLSKDERQTIDFAVDHVRVGGYNPKPTFAGKKSSYHRRRKKKK